MKNILFGWKYILVAVICIGILLRFYQLGVNPPSLDWDEASLGYNAYSILKTGADEYGNKFPLVIRSFDDYKPPAYVYLDIPFIALFGLTEFAVRLPAAVIGVLSIPVVFFLVLELLQNWKKEQALLITLLSSLFIAISPWHLQFSKAAFEGNIGLFFLLLGILLFFKGLKKNIFLIISTISFIFGLYSYHSFRLLIPLIIFILISLFFKELKKKIVIAIICLLLLFVSSLPIFLSFLGSNGSGSRLSMVTIFSTSEKLDTAIKRSEYDKNNHDYIGLIFHNRRFVFAQQIIKGYFDHFDLNYLFIYGDGGRQHHAVDMGMLYLWDLPFIILGFLYLTQRIDRRVILILLLLFIAPLPSAITTGTPHPVRSIAMMPALLFLSAIGFAYLINSPLKKGKQIVIGIASVFLLLNFIYYMHQYYVHTPIEYGDFWQYGNKEAVEFAKQHEDDYQHIVMTYAYDQPYIYYLFYNKVDPLWYQRNWNYSGTGEVDRMYRKIRKYEFKKINYTLDSQNKKTLLIGTEEEIPSQAKAIKTIYFPNGKVAYKIAAL